MEDKAPAFFGLIKREEERVCVREKECVCATEKECVRGNRVSKKRRVSKEVGKYFWTNYVSFISKCVSWDQFSTVYVWLKKPMDLIIILCTPPYVSKVQTKLPLKQFQCSEFSVSWVLVFQTIWNCLLALSLLACLAQLESHVAAMLADRVERQFSHPQRKEMLLELLGRHFVDTYLSHVERNPQALVSAPSSYCSRVQRNPQVLVIAPSSYLSVQRNPQVLVSAPSSYLSVQWNPQVLVSAPSSYLSHVQWNPQVLVSAPSSYFSVQRNPQVVVSAPSSYLSVQWNPQVVVSAPSSYLSVQWNPQVLVSAPFLLP